MVNKAFREATTQTGFMLALSKNQVKVLVEMRTNAEGWIWEVSAMPWGMKTLTCLFEKGLVSAGQEGWNLTDAGRITTDLLLIAGFQKKREG